MLHLNDIKKGNREKLSTHMMSAQAIQCIATKKDYKLAI